MDYGTLTVNRKDHASCGNSVRALWGGGLDPNASNVIDYITITKENNDNKISQVQNEFDKSKQRYL